MARKPKRDMTMEQQLAAGPVDLPFLMLALIVNKGLMNWSFWISLPATRVARLLRTW